MTAARGVGPRVRYSSPSDTRPLSITSEPRFAPSPRPPPAPPSFGTTHFEPRALPVRQIATSCPSSSNVFPISLSHSHLRFRPSLNPVAAGDVSLRVESVHRRSRIMASGRIEGNELTPLVTQYREYYLVSFWVEANIYGGYVLLFALAMNVMRKRDTRSFSARFHFACMTIMFFLISLHNASNIYRMIHAYSDIPETNSAPAAPVNYLRQCENWDCYLYLVTQVLLTLIADVLVIYRCYIVWNRSIRVIVPSLLLLLGSFGFSVVWLWWFKHPLRYPLSTIRSYLGIHFPINFAQSILTTGLISYRIWSQHRIGEKAGLNVEANTSLIVVFRIIVESAMIWTFEMFLLIVLYHLKHPAIDIVQHAMIPSIGIVFVLMAVRSHLAQEAASSALRGGASTAASAFIFRTWFDRSSDREDEERETNRSPMDTSSHLRRDRSPVRRRDSTGDIELQSVHVGDMKRTDMVNGEQNEAWRARRGEGSGTSEEWEVVSMRDLSHRQSVDPRNGVPYAE